MDPIKITFDISLFFTTPGAGIKKDLDLNGDLFKIKPHPGFAVL